MRNHAAQLAIIKQLSRQELHSTAGNCQAKRWRPSPASGSVATARGREVRQALSGAVQLAGLTGSGGAAPTAASGGSDPQVKTAAGTAPPRPLPGSGVTPELEPRRPGPGPTCPPLGLCCSRSSVPLMFQPAYSFLPCQPAHLLPDSSWIFWEPPESGGLDAGRLCQ